MIIDIPNDFNYAEYRELNDDLYNLSEYELITHYINYGFYEKRFYKYNLPNDFNYLEYQELNPFLHDFTENQCKKHYTEHGFYEKRLYKYNDYQFNLNNYTKYINSLQNNKLYLIKLYILYNFGFNNLNIDYFGFNEIELSSFKNKIYNIKNIKIENLEIYIMLEKYYKLNYNLDINLDNAFELLIIDNKEHLKYLCYRYINYIKNYKINIDYDINNHNETVLIFFQKNYNIEFNIRKICYELNNWKHTIICNNYNYNFIKKICSDISEKINIINIDIGSNFWDYITGHYILIYNEESIIINSDIDKWLKYDYVNSQVIIKKRLDNFENIYNGNIDCFLSIDFDKSILNNFNKCLKQYYNQGINKLIEYKHRYGWKNILIMLYINDIICFNHDNIELIDLSESYFVWNNKTINKSWIGIFHYTPTSPDYLDNINILIDNENFKSSLHYCNKIICLSNYLTNYIKLKIKNINIQTIYHPIITNINKKKKFNISNYILNNNKKIIQIGNQLRNLKTFLILEIPKFKKLWLPGTDNINKIQYLLKKEMDSNEDIRLQDYNIEIINVNNLEFDKLLKNNIIFLHVHDSSANNTILEAIIYQIPIIVNRHPAIIEYLGAKYPLYFDNINEIKNLITVKKIIESHIYLSKLDLSKYTYMRFNQGLVL